MADINEMMRGNIETLILQILMGSDQYGYQIAKIFRTCSNNKYELKEASMYTAFKRLEEGGLVTSYWGDSHGGGCRKYYSITEQGKAAITEYIEAWETVRGLINNILEGKHG